MVLIPKNAYCNYKLIIKPSFRVALTAQYNLTCGEQGTLLKCVYELMFLIRLFLISNHTNFELLHPMNLVENQRPHLIVDKVDYEVQSNCIRTLKISHI